MFAKSFLTVLLTSGLAASLAAQQSAQTTLNEEVRRQQQELAADELVRNAENAQLAGRFQDAVDTVAKAEAIYKTLGSSRHIAEKTQSTHKLHVVALASLASSMAKQARESSSVALYEKALICYRQVNELDPGSRQQLAPEIKAVEKALDEQKFEAEVGRQKLKSEARDQKNQIQPLLDQARILYAARRFGECKDKIDEIYVLDPFNTSAAQLRTRNDLAMLASAKDRKTNTMQEIDAEINWKWASPVSAASNQNRASGVTGKSTESVTSKIQEKLTSIVFPKIKYEGANLKEVIADIILKSKRLDPDQTGLNIILAAPSLEQADGQKAITLEFEDIKAGDLLRTIAQMSGMRFKIEAFSIVISDSNLATDSMETRYFPVSATVAESVVTPEGGDKPDWMAHFKKFSIEFPPGAKIAYVAGVSRLVVTNTDENLIKIESIIRQLDIPTTQVSIEAKILDVDINDIKELGVQWRYTTSTLNPTLDNPAAGGAAGGAAAVASPNGGRDMKPFTGDTFFTQSNNGTAGGNGQLDGGIRSLKKVESLGLDENPVQLGADVVFGHQQLQMLVRALDQKDTNEILSAPKVTTAANSTAIIRVVEEHFFPSEWEAPEVQGQIIVPSTPVYKDKRDVGVILEVTPLVDPDGYTIEMELKPQIVSFLGYDTTFDDVYSVITPLGQMVPGLDPNALAIIDFRNSMPILEVRSIETKVKVWDGETVMLGGLIKETVTKVDDGIPYLRDIPLLGRLFENKGESHRKTNLMVFVSPRLVTPGGSAVRPTNLKGIPDFNRL
jgi:Flp pilus assembly secretin CpaC/tetratricopeptide (TPR) repeat protein